MRLEYNNIFKTESGNSHDPDFWTLKNRWIDPDVERRMLKEKKITRKWKFGWFYEPDKFDQWLEGMESKGYNLYEANKWWTRFYFYAGKPRKIKYYSDYQRRLYEDYYEQHEQDGWGLAFTPQEISHKFTIWCKEYNDGDPVPQFYPEKAEMVKQAKKLLGFSWMNGVTSLICLGGLILNVFNICYNDLHIAVNTLSMISIFISCVLGILVMFEFGSFVIRPILYYRRIKRKASEL